MSGLQLALALGLLIGAGVAVGVWALVPAQPDLADVLARLSPTSRRRQGPVLVGTGQGSEERVGIWAERRLPARLLGAVERVDTAMCKIRDGGKVRARDRIAVLAALNLAFDLTDQSTHQTLATTSAAPALAGQPSEKLGALLARLDDALNRDDRLL